MYKTHYDAYHYAGSIEQRLEDFQWALNDEQIKAIWISRGGYGAVHLLDLINWEKFKQNPNGSSVILTSLPFITTSTIGTSQVYMQSRLNV